MVDVAIESRFRGLPGIALGGYVGGLLAGERTAEVRFQRPAPVGRPLRIETRGDGTTALLDGPDCLALSRPADVDLEVPALVAPEAAQAAAAAFSGFSRHLFPECFVCGPARPEGDGLRIFPGPIPGREVVAALWTPHASLGVEDGKLPPEFVWSAMDCPSIWPLIHHEPRGSREQVVSALLALQTVPPGAAGARGALQ